MTALRFAAAVVLGLLLGGLPLLRYRFAAPHAGHDHTTAHAAPERK